MTNVEFVIQMEKDGEKYYKEQAQKNKGNELENLFLDLANDEKKHAEIIENWAKKNIYDLKESEIIKKFTNVFKNKDEIKSNVRFKPEQLEIYQFALKIENESIELYEKMLKEANDDLEKRLFEFLISEENRHKEIFENLIDHVRKAEEWVESAEFGIRKDKY
ncbi:Rubrerythrin [Thermoanaerobacter uzonensis DSM 18761]|uniref:Rubrerythrin n=1 Tax=Thermoanaerobacter uzonensis DSM 18761 TaxID=1123369 RepID=A0A1M4W6M7_9THEO|nr:ferritin family protein [Thermoanaerobacter uzonensis]SHE76908.1 Rubrerythrin [Thermoanaerobacter uzonensis DSM 18761]